MEGGSNAPRMEKSQSVEAVNICHAMTSEKPTPLKGAQSIGCVDLASSTLPAADAGLKQARSVDAVNKPGLRRNYFSFDDKWLARINTHQDMDFDDNDSWSQVSYESSVASTTDAQTRRLPPISGQLSKKNSGSKDLDPLQSASRRGLSHSMILNWLSHKRYVPANEPISEGTIDGTSSVAGSDMVNPAPPKVGVLTGAAQSLIAGSEPAKTSPEADVKKQIKINYRELNAVSPSYW